MQQNRTMTLVMGAAAVAIVLGASGVPLVTLLPLAFLLACPLMMFMMMRGGMMRGGHGDSRGCGHHDHSDHSDPTKTGQTQP